MNSNAIKILALLCSIMVLSAISVKAQTIIKIGEAELVIQAPISVKKGDSLEVNDVKELAYTHDKARKKFKPRFSSNLYVGVGLAVPLERDLELPVHYGESYNLEIGVRSIYRLSRFYGIGTMVSYSFYNYKLADRPFEDIFSVSSANIRSEYFRTDNVSLGFYNRFYITGTKRPRVRIDAGAYGDFAVSRRYKVKSRSDSEGRSKEKYRDGSAFNPLQGGLYGALALGDWSVFAKYRLTNQFNPDKNLNETPRLNIGLRWDL